MFGLRLCRLRSAIILVATVAIHMASWVQAIPPEARPAQRNREPAVVTPPRAAATGRSASLAAQEEPQFDMMGVNLLARVPVEVFSSGSGSANDVWGYVSPSGREYAILGLTEGTGFVDITNPTQPVVLADIPDARSTWSDMAVYGEYAYNVNENSGGMQIFDLTEIDQGIVTLVGSLTSNGFRSAHNVFINRDSGFAYLCGANSPSSGLVAVDLSAPTNPVMVGIWWEHYSHDVYVTSYDDCPYSGRSGPCEIAFSFGGGAGLSIVDVTDKTNMTTISDLRYTNTAYAHQGWLTEDRRYLLVGDEGDENTFGLKTTTYVIDVSDLENPTEVTTFTNGMDSIDHNLMVRGDYVFEANYTSGLRIYDISDVNNVTQVGYIDTFPANDNRSFSGAWGVFSDFPSGNVLVSDQSNGLFVIDPSPAVGCTFDSNCNDLDPCTADSCMGNSECSHTLEPAGTPCVHENVCMIDGECDAAGACEGTDINTIVCSDDGPCGHATCNTQAGLCDCAPCTIPDPPAEELVVTRKNRHLTIIPGSPGELSAIRVTLLAMPPPFDVLDGEVRWVGMPEEYSENSGKRQPWEAPGFPTFWAAPLRCQPLFRDWGSQEPLQVSGAEIVPGGEYIMQTVSPGCYAAGADTFSSPLTLRTSMWGDVVGSCATDPCEPPDGTVDVTTDVTAILNKFTNLTGAPIKARADLEPDLLDHLINISDVTRAMDAFRGRPYPGVVPLPCE